jgi:hypothetical protein
MPAKIHSINKTARIAGFLYFLLAPLGFFGGMYIPSLIVSGDATATVNNILAHLWLYRLSIICALSVPIVNIFLVLQLYKLLKPVNKNSAVLMVVFIVAVAPIAMFNELSLFAVLHLLNHPDYLRTFSMDQLYSQVMFFLDLNHYGFFIVAIFWGLWLFPLGQLIFKSGFLPKAIGILMVIAGFGYVFDSFMFFLLPGLNMSISKYTFIGELVLLLWLLVKGVNVAKWEKCNLESSLK